MPRPVREFLVDPTRLALITDALRADASRRQRTAMRAAGELEVDVVEGKVADRRPTAVRITKVLAEAAVLVNFAESLEALAATQDLTPIADALRAEGHDVITLDPDLDPDLEVLTEPPTAPNPDPDPSDALALAAAAELGIKSVLDEDDVVDPEEVLTP